MSDAYAVDPWSDPDILRGRLADAQAEIERLTTMAANQRDRLVAEVKRRGRLIDRAEAALAKERAKVARARELLDESDMIWPDPAEWAAEGVREFAERLRDALDGAE